MCLPMLVKVSDLPIEQLRQMRSERHYFQVASRSERPNPHKLAGSLTNTSPMRQRVRAFGDASNARTRWRVGLVLAGTFSLADRLSARAMRQRPISRRR